MLSPLSSAKEQLFDDWHMVPSSARPGIKKTSVHLVRNDDTENNKLRGYCLHRYIVVSTTLSLIDNLVDCGKRSLRTGPDNKGDKNIIIIMIIIRACSRAAEKGV